MANETRLNVFLVNMQAEEGNDFQSMLICGRRR